MERLELKTSVGTRVLIGMLFALVLIPAAIFGKAVGLVIAIAGLAGFVWLCVAMGKRRLIIDEHGVTAKGMTKDTRIAWDELDHYTFWSMDQQAVYAAGGQGAIVVIVVMLVIAIVKKLRRGKHDNRRFSQGRLTLVSTGKLSLAIDGRYKDVGHALDRVFAEMHPRLRERHGTPTDFAPFTLTETELRHTKKGTLGLADIEKVSAAMARISIKKRGKRLAWAAVSMKKVKNVMLFLEVLAEHGLVVNANAEVFMPPTVLDKLRAAASRQAAMPQARVVAR